MNLVKCILIVLFRHSQFTLLQIKSTTFCLVIFSFIVYVLTGKEYKILFVYLFCRSQFILLQDRIFFCLVDFVF